MRLLAHATNARVTNPSCVRDKTFSRIGNPLLGYTSISSVSVKAHYQPLEAG